MKKFNLDAHRGWIEAAKKVVSPNPEERKVACPDCGHRYLSIHDLPSDEDCQESSSTARRATQPSTFA
jgi:hypothetical protein